MNTVTDKIVELANIWSESPVRYTIITEGIKHPLLEESSLDFEETKFMVTCSATINYLIVNVSKVGIDLKLD